MTPVIKRGNCNISTSFRKYLSNIPGKHEIKEVQKKKNSYIGHYTHVIQKALMASTKHM
jgi:hypothetical protein